MCVCYVYVYAISSLLTRQRHGPFTHVLIDVLTDAISHHNRVGMCNCCIKTCFEPARLINVKVLIVQVPNVQVSNVQVPNVQVPCVQVQNV